MEAIFKRKVYTRKYYAGVDESIRYYGRFTIPISVLHKDYFSHMETVKIVNNEDLRFLDVCDKYRIDDEDFKIEDKIFLGKNTVEFLIGKRVLDDEIETYERARAEADECNKMAEERYQSQRNVVRHEDDDPIAKYEESTFWCRVKKIFASVKLD